MTAAVRHFNSIEQIDEFISSLNRLKLLNLEKLASLKQSLNDNLSEESMGEHQLRDTHKLLSNLSMHAHESKLLYQDFQSSDPDLASAKSKIISFEEQIAACASLAKQLAQYQLLTLITSLILVVSSFVIFIGLTIGLGSVIPSLPIIALTILIPTLIVVIVAAHAILKQISTNFNECYAQMLALDNQLNREIKPLRLLVRTLESNPQIVEEYDQAVLEMDAQIAEITLQLDDFIEKNPEDTPISEPCSPTKLLDGHGFFQTKTNTVSVPMDNTHQHPEPSEGYPEQLYLQPLK